MENLHDFSMEFRGFFHAQAAVIDE